MSNAEEFRVVNADHLEAMEKELIKLRELIKEAHAWIDHNNFGGWDAYELRDRLLAALK